MIVIIHNNQLVLKAYNTSDYNDIITIPQKRVVNVLFEIAVQYHNSIIVWAHETHKTNLNLEYISEALYLRNVMLSFSCSKYNYLPEQIGYIDDTSPFININKHVKYPTWLMNGQVGATYASNLLKFKDVISLNNSLNYVLNSISKLGMAKGLFCYSDFNLLKKPFLDKNINQANELTVFKFVRQHYKISWIFLMFLNYLRHERSVLLIPLINAIFYRRIKYEGYFDIELFNKSIPTQPIENPSIDVIIPTIGRREYLFNVLNHLSEQTLKPQKVIIVEQNSEKNSKSQLDYIYNKNWPFKVIHKFTHQTGVCNARNIALKELTSEYVYLADDDIEFEPSLLKKAIKILCDFNLNSITISCLQKDEIEPLNKFIQWSTFASGSSIIKYEYIKNIKFNIALEHGYGEDVDFGMQLRNSGTDIIYVPNLKVLHLKAPIGGFRTKTTKPWENENIQPKPSPTVMLNRLNNTTKYQLLGYQTRLLIQYYKYQNIKNPFKYFKIFIKQWNYSKHWANQLKSNFK